MDQVPAELLTQHGDQEPRIVAVQAVSSMVDLCRCRLDPRASDSPGTRKRDAAGLGGHISLHRSPSGLAREQARKPLCE